MTEEERFDQAALRMVNDRLEQWGHYRLSLMSSSREYASSISMMYQEAVAYKRGEAKEHYPYQTYVYKCDGCDKMYLEKPFNKHGNYDCPKCHSDLFHKIDEGVSGLKVFAAMIRPTGSMQKGWNNEVDTEQAIRALPFKQRRVVFINYLDSDPQAKKAEKLKIKLRKYHDLLLQAKLGIYMYLKGTTQKPL